MRIAILGSSATSSEVGGGITEPARLEDFCRNLGLRLASSSHSLLLESDNPRTADRLVVDGMLAAAPPRKGKVKVYHRYRRNRNRPFVEEAKREGKLFQFVRLPDRLLSPTHLHVLREADVAIVVGGGRNSYPAGLAAAFMGVRLIPIATFGGAGGLLWEQLTDEFEKPHIKLPTRRTWDSLASDPETVLQALLDEVARLPRLMVVHGRSSRDRERLIEILEAYGVTEPVVLQERFRSGQTVPEKFEWEAVQADGAIALFTPDDAATPLLDPTGNPISTSEVQQRARQNVALEYGWFWGRLGRGRVLLLLKGELQLPSDLAGLIYESYTGDPEDCKPAIHKFVDSIRSGEIQE
jgi:predicted nucleotide-binding protein